jgi:hypothetical protein
MTTSQKPTSLLEAVRTSLAHAGLFSPGDAAPPAAILWLDGDAQWTSLVAALRAQMPELLALGEYDPETRTGPAIWLRCVIEPEVRRASFPDLSWPADAVPVIYLPNVTRQLLRAGEECPDLLKPLVELQYRGAVWGSKSGRDWTVRAFLTSQEVGLGLDVAEDRQTAESLRVALPVLATTPVDRLRGRRLQATDFDKLMSGDTIRDLLLWLGDPAGTRAAWDAGKWSAFCGLCRTEFGFDPDKDGPLAGGELLGTRSDRWQPVWDRFAEAPGACPGVPALLRKAKPTAALLFQRDAWPDEAESAEASLRSRLLSLAALGPAETRAALRKLEDEHGERRSWVWAKLDMCPLARALEHLSSLASVTEAALGGESSDAMALQYCERGFRADDAVLRAIACARREEDRGAVTAAVRAAYLPWLDDGAEALQKRLTEEGDDPGSRNKPIELEEGDCLLFVDGLRYDLAERLASAMEEQGADVARSWRWAALPTVTSTAKPAVSPLGGEVSRTSDFVPDYTPQYGKGKKPLTTDRLRQELAARKVTLLDSQLPGTAAASGTAWDECSSFDKLGHDLGMRLADQLEQELAQLAERISALLSAGWRRVRIVTDHGWLWVPGGLPVFALPNYLTESKWSRCAAVKDSSLVQVRVFGWTWNPSERFASAPGAKSFRSGVEYAHGGVSLQECVNPELVVTSSTQRGEPVRIDELSWAKLRCRARVSLARPGLRLDIRTKQGDPSSSLGRPAEIGSDGKVSVLVEDEEKCGVAVRVVVIDAAGDVVASLATTVGGEET